MYSVAYCAAIRGIEGCIIQAETDVSEGLPGFSLVGFLSSEVKEAKERVRIALKNSGFRLLPKKITVNLSPADIRKAGTGYDLAIAVSVLAAFGYFSQEYIAKIAFIGELSLDGKIHEIHGILPMVYTAYAAGMKYCIVPEGNYSEAMAVEGIGIIGVSGLAQLVRYLQKETFPKQPEMVCHDGEAAETFPDFADVSGQAIVRRAVEVATAGRHNLLMIGPPGSGKTMIAKRIPGIMPQMSFEEQMEISKIYSVAGLLSKSRPLVQKRPFRSPHHTITEKALIGGGTVPRPGEISLANGGVLFLDELGEFQRQTIDLLRQPLEEGVINISRIDGNYSYPANCQLVAATNPCRCGYFPNRKRCSCTSWEVKNYLGKISQPMLDRMDICVETTPLEYDDFGPQRKENEPSSAIRERVAAAQGIQSERYRKEAFFHNSQLPPASLDTYCVLSESAKSYLKDMFQQMSFSARMYHKVLKVCRTIADLAGSVNIEKEHVAEAVFYRSIDKKYWGNERMW
ncbi:MAG: YifB family Mg chelatase-like AAA ATPase [Clostridiaceae bacterium]|nr:YifB family Mg chelatase-like AAA ATPase [Clostridiaceae bacterium]